MATAGSSIDFDGSSGTSYITMGSFSGLNGATEVTFSLWVNFNSIGGNTSFGSQYNDFSNTNWFSSSAADTAFMVKNGGAYAQAVSDEILTDLLNTGEWHYLTYTWKRNADDITDWDFFLDASSINISLGAVNGTITAIGSGAYDYEIGCLNSNSFNIDSKEAFISIYDRQISEDEAKEIMYNPFSLPINIVSLIPLHKATPVDMVTGDVADVVGGDADLDTSGPPIYTTGYYC